MSLADILLKIPGVRRVLGATRYSTLDQYAADWLKDQVRSAMTAAGVDVTPSTALTLPAYYGILRVLSQSIGGLPRSAFRDDDGVREKMPDHRVTRIINNPNDEMTGMAFWESRVENALAWGRGLAEVERDRWGTAVALWPRHPSQTELIRQNGELWWRYRQRMDIDGSNEPRYIRPVNMIHLHGLGGNGLTGYSLLQVGMKAIGLGLAQQDFAAGFFANDMKGGMIFSVDKTPSPEAKQKWIENLRTWAEMRHAHRSLFLEGGIKADRIDIPPKDAMMIETGMFSVIQMCRLAGVPPHKVAALERATFSNIEHQAIEFVQDGVLPWTLRIEEECNRKLFGPRRGAFYIHHNLDGLLRSDYKTRTEGDRSLVGAGIITPDEARSHYELPPYPNGIGAKPYMQGAMKSLEDIAEPPEPEPQPIPPQLLPPGEEPEEEEEERENAASVKVSVRARTKRFEKDIWDAAVESLRPVFSATAERVVRREIQAVSSAFPSRGGDRENWIAWANRWHSEERAYIRSVFASPIQSLTLALNGNGRRVDLDGCLDEWQAAAIQRTAAIDSDENLGLFTALAPSLSTSLCESVLTCACDALENGDA